MAFGSGSTIASTRRLSMHLSACLVAALGAGPGSFGEPVRLSAGEGTGSDPGADLIGSTVLAALVEGDTLILRAAHGGDSLEIARPPDELLRIAEICRRIVDAHELADGYGRGDRGGC